MPSSSRQAWPSPPGVLLLLLLCLSTCEDMCPSSCACRVRFSWVQLPVGFWAMWWLWVYSFEEPPVCPSRGAALASSSSRQVPRLHTFTSACCPGASCPLMCDIGRLFLCLLAICVHSLEKCLFIFFAHLKLGSLCVLDISRLSGVSASHSSQAVGVISLS